MRLTPEQLYAYLKRLGYEGALDVSAKTLHELHVAHTFTVPFENLDIHLGRSISLEIEALFDKIVTQRRGGYCYEGNGLFAYALEALGFDVRRLMGRIVAGYSEVRPLTHQVLLVTIDSQRWIADVACGRNGLIAPIPLEIGTVYRQYSESFRLLSEDNHRYSFQTQIDEQWQDIYTFTLEPYLPVDYVPANYFNSTHPESRFVKQAFCTRATPHGRVTLVGAELKIQENGSLQIMTIPDLPAYYAALKTYFDLDLDVPFAKSPV